MRKRGFTLIELLAVIVVLAIIALIATPIVMNLIKNANKGAAERSAERYKHAVETAVANARVNDKITPDGIYVVDEEGNLCLQGTTCTDETELKVDVAGDIPESGSLIAIENGQVVATGTLMTIGDYQVTIDSEKKLVAALPGPACEVKTGDGTNLGDEIECGGEYFYVIKNDGSNIQMLAKYNLNVGDNTVEGTIGIQNELATGFTSDPTNCKDLGCNGGVPFADSFYWTEGCDQYGANCTQELLTKYGTSYPAEVYDDNSSLFGYVGNYENYLKTTLKVTSASASLINIEQLGLVECDLANYTCSSAPEWVYQTTYFTAVAQSTTGVYEVFTDTNLAPALSMSGTSVGVRPVVTISVEEI